MEREGGLIKDDTSGDVDTARGDIKAYASLMSLCITKEHTSNEPRGEFVLSVRA